MAAASDTLTTRLEMVGLGTFTSAFGQAANAIGIFEDKLDAAGKKQLSMGIGAGAAAAGIAVGLGKAVSAAGRVQQVEIGFKTMLGSAEAARAKVEELQKFAAGSPFDFEQTAKGAQQMLAMGISADKLIPTMEALGNAVAASGGGTEEFLGAARALGQIQTKGKLSQEELNQFAERGIPAMQILKDELGLSAKQLQNIGAAGIPAEKAVDALVRGFNKRFAGGMEEQSKSLFGAFSNLTDSVNQLLAAIGVPLVGVVTKATQVISGMAGWLAAAKPLAGALGVAAAVLGARLAWYSAQTILAVGATARLMAAQAAGTPVAQAYGAAQAQAAGGAGGPGGAVGLMGRMGGKAGLIRGGTAAAAGLAFGALGQDRSVMGGVGRTLAGAVGGAVLGSMIAPGIGTVIGGLAGAAYGGYESVMGARGAVAPPAPPSAAPASDPDKDRQIRLLEEQVALLKQMHGAIVKSVSGPPSARSVLDGASTYRALGRAAA